MWRRVASTGPPAIQPAGERRVAAVTLPILLRLGGATRAQRGKRVAGFRVGEIRVYYDVTGNTVEVLAIVAKSEAESWLAQFGKAE